MRKNDRFTFTGDRNQGWAARNSLVILNTEIIQKLNNII